MKVLAASDSYKGSLSSIQVVEAMKNGVLSVYSDAQVLEVPMADGGEGTVEALVAATDGKIVHTNVSDPLGKSIKAFYGILGDKKTAVIEMAAASGLPLVDKENRNPMNTTTYGTGELIKAALDNNCTKLIIGIGGSATNDGGTGMAQALGVKFFDKDKKELGTSGKFLNSIDKIDINGLDPRIKNVEIVVACDVNNPLCGKNGASAVYGPQKGATAKMIEELDKGLANLAEKLKAQLNKDIKDLPGSGAAGGLGGGLVAFLDAKLKSGIEIVIEATRLEDLIKEMDIVLTGEGQTDFQTAYGKVPAGVAKIAKKHNTPVVCISGGLGDNIESLYDIGLTSLFSIVNRPMKLENAMSESYELINQTVQNLFRTIKSIQTK